MKHIKLFEAFESEKLSKTIRFIKDKFEFKEILNKIGRKLDFPISEFEDSMFEYLPYYQALKKDVTEIKLDELGKPKIQLIKFWFTKDGEFVCLTGNDGNNNDNTQSFSRKIEDYDVVKDLTSDEVKNLEKGQIVLFTPDGTGDDIAVVGSIWRYERGIWVLQDRYDGDTPNNISWDSRREIARYSWSIASRGTFLEIKLLKPIDKKISNRELDLYDWKLASENSLDADFAIILDINKIEESMPKSLSGIRSEREDRKSGAFLSNEKIKQINIERFLNKLADKFDFENSFENLSRVVTRSLGQKYALFFIVREHNLSIIGEVMTLLYYFIKNPSDSIKKEILDNLRELYSSHEKVSELTKIIDDIRKNNPEYLRVLESCLGISDLLYQKISNQKIENISDIEVLIEKIYLFKRFLTNSRLPHIRGIRIVAWGLENGTSSVLDELEWCADRGEEFFETVKSVERAIEKIF
jgi:hypothetical protein